MTFRVWEFIHWNIAIVTSVSVTIAMKIISEKYEKPIISKYIAQAKEYFLR